MDFIPFNESELEHVGVYKGRRGNPDHWQYKYPITARENWRRLYNGEPTMWFPRNYELVRFCPRVLPENLVRGFVIEANPATPDEFGGKDLFGVEWVFEHTVNGAMTKPGNPAVKDPDSWRDYITVPDVDSWDWAGNAESNKEFARKLIDGGHPIQTVLYTGFYERLISWLDFEDAAVAMIDEDDRETVMEIYDFLSGVYCDIIRHIRRWFPFIDMIQLHDDWGSQIAPFFSTDTLIEVVSPYLKKVSNCCHECGFYFDQHSCGKHEASTPAMIAGGVDSWMPQRINDTEAVCRKYGDKIIINVTPDDTPSGLSAEEYDAMAKRWVDEHIELYRTNPFIMHPTSSDPTGRAWVAPEFMEGIYKYSRIALCGESE